jgi:hypothetical protein
MIKLINLTPNTIIIYRRDGTLLEIPVSGQKAPLSRSITKDFYIVDRDMLDAMDNPKQSSFMVPVDPIYDKEGHLVGYKRLEFLSREG